MENIIIVIRIERILRNIIHELLTWATFSPIFGVWRDPWKNFPDPLS